MALLSQSYDVLDPNSAPIIWSNLYHSAWVKLLSSTLFPTSPPKIPWSTKRRSQTAFSSEQPHSSFKTSSFSVTLTDAGRLLTLQWWHFRILVFPLIFSLSNTSWNSGASSRVVVTEVMSMLDIFDVSERVDSGEFGTEGWGRAASLGTTSANWGDVTKN